MWNPKEHEIPKINGSVFPGVENDFLPHGNHYTEYQNKWRKQMARSNNKVNRDIKKIPYSTDATPRDICLSGASLLKPVVRYFKSHQDFTPSTRWPLNLVDHEENNIMDLLGIVSGYRIVVQHHVALIYILLKDVVGNHGSTPIFVSDHLWINPNFTNQYLMKSRQKKNTRHNTIIPVGVGDVVCVKGRPKIYTGMVGNQKQRKMSLANTIVCCSGYPLFDKNGNYKYSSLNYLHDTQCLYFRRANQIRLGDEVSHKEKETLLKKGIPFGDMMQFLINSSIHYGEYVSKDSKMTYRITTFHDKKGIQFRWSEHPYNATLLSKKNYDEMTDFQRTYQVNARLKKRFGNKLWQLILSPQNMLHG